MSLVVKAIHTFVAEHGDELEFQAGESITVLEKDDAFGDGWWRVCRRLSNFVQDADCRGAMSAVKRVCFLRRTSLKEASRKRNR